MLPEVQLALSNGLRYAIIGRSDLISNAVIRGGFEDNLRAISSNLLHNVKDGIVLDIGANMGSYTLPIAAAHPHLQVYSFEPQRVVFYQLCTNIFMNRLDNVYAHNYGLSNSTWTKSFEVPDYINENNIGAFSVDDDVRSKGYLVTTHGNLEQVHAIPLDTMQLKNVRLIKIDVEGHELEALQGASETIKASNYPPILFESWDDRFADKQKILFEYITSMGYKITGVDGNSNYLAVHIKENK